MIYGGHATLNPHPRPLRRKTSALDAYYRNGIRDSEGLGSLGVAFSDLPNGGHNLRLYTYDPIGSQFGPKNSCGSEPTNTWVYNTGHYDISLGTPCSQPDSQGFCDWNTMSQYAAGRGEMLVLVSRADLTALCGYRAPIAPAPVPPVTAPLPLQPVTGPLPPVGSGLTPGRGVAPTAPAPTTPGAPGAPGSVSTVITTTTTPGSVTGGGGGPSGGGFPVYGGGGGASGAPYAGPQDNTLLYVALAALALVYVVSKND